jgi:hypothetical protein
LDFNEKKALKKLSLFLETKKRYMEPLTNKVFGIGLNKTGTTSLGKALEILGYQNHTSVDLKSLRNFRNGKLEKVIRKTRSYNNFEDWPWPLMYKELFAVYPKAKFVLTVRKTDEVWFNSLEKYAAWTGPTEHRKLAYGYEMPNENPEYHINFYKTHNQEVRDFFEEKSPDSFLEICFEKGDGWEKLCDFLGKEVPEEPFPFLNKSPKGKKKSKWFHWFSS